MQSSKQSEINFAEIKITDTLSVESPQRSAKNQHQIGNETARPEYGSQKPAELFAIEPQLIRNVKANEAKIHSDCWSLKDSIDQSNEKQIKNG